MPEWITTLQSFLPDRLGQILMSAGVVIGTILGVVKMFNAGQRANQPARRSAESDLRGEIKALRDSNTAQHSETHDRLENLSATIAVLEDRTRRG